MALRGVWRCHMPCFTFMFLFVSGAAFRGTSKQRAENDLPHASSWQQRAEDVLPLAVCFVVSSVAAYQALATLRQRTGSAKLSRWQRVHAPMTLIGAVACVLGFVLFALSVYGSCGFFAHVMEMEWGGNANAFCDDAAQVDLWEFTARPSDLTEPRMRNIATLPSGVPKIIHQMWKESSTTRQHAAWVKSWKQYNPDWLHVVWTDADIWKLIAEKYPEAKSQYNSYSIPVMRADMARPYILYTYGGVYVDLDYENFAALDHELGDCSVCLVASPYKQNDEEVQNSFMASSSNHAIWPILWRLLREHASKYQQNVDILRTTGPGVLTEALHQYEAHTKSQVRRLSFDRFMFGNSTQAGPAVAKHWYDHSYLPDAVREQFRRVGVSTVYVSTMCVAVLILVAYVRKSSMYS